MKQQSLFNFVKKIDKDDIEKQKIKLNEQPTTLSKKSITSIRKRNNVHLLDGLNYNPENCIIKNENKSNIIKKQMFGNNTDNCSTYSMTSTPIKKLKLDSKENINPVKEDSFDLNDSFEFSDFFPEDSSDGKSVKEYHKKPFYRVKIVNVDDLENSKKIIGNLDDNDGVVNIYLEGNWRDSDVIVGDVCHVINPVVVGHEWHLTDVNGLIVINPDSLLSGTTIVGSLFCTRKTVIQNYFNDIAGKNSKAMMLGTFIHTIFQECVTMNTVDVTVVRGVASRLMTDKPRLLQFYEGELLEADILTELDIYIPHIVLWIQKNISSTCGGKKVVDIEENIWSAKYGMKGKVDVTLQSNNRAQTIMPLELKTGKTSFSNEHIGQVILYTLMLSEKREEISQGLLLYIKDGKEKVIESKAPSVTGLIKIRNELGKQLLRFLSSDLMDQDILPPVINSDRICSKCDYLSLCTLFSRISNTEYPQEHAMRNLMKENANLSDKDHEFFMRWTKLILMEYLSQHRSENTVMQIVTQKSENCIRGAVLETSLPDQNNYMLTFTFAACCYNKFSEGDPVIVSTNDGSKLALTIGFVVGLVGIGSISLSSEKLLSCPAQTLLRIDAYSSLKIPMLNLSLMANFMNASDISHQLRSLIVNGEPPVFDSGFSREMIEKIKPILKKSNADQRKAILTAILAKNYTLIKGYPGSGKTSCIVSMIKVFASTGAKVLVSSYTHSAVVNILMKLDQKVTNFVYLNGTRRACPELKSRTLDVLMESNNVQNTSDVYKLLDGISVFGVTCLSMHHPSLSKIKFDLVIIDEAGQITLPISLMPLMKLKTENSRFVLVGDLHQLPPLVTNSTARSEGLDQSLLATLCDYSHPRSISELTIQYRMNKEILKICNRITYDNCITCADEVIANATSPHLRSSAQYSSEDSPAWMKRCLSPDIADSVLFLDNAAAEAACTYSSESEARIINDIIEALLAVGVPGSDIGVISPYNSQVDLIRRLCAAEVEVNTIDQYQGKDKSIILISFVRCSCGVSVSLDNTSKIDILMDRRRLNVALTRAKHKLIMVGSLDHLTKTYVPLREVSQVLTADQIVPI